MSRSRVAITCREIACNHLVSSAVSYLNTRGRDTRILVQFDTHVYCSFDCQSRNERIQKLDRIDQLITALFFEYSETPTPTQSYQRRFIKSNRETGAKSMRSAGRTIWVRWHSRRTVPFVLAVDLLFSL
jgi:hypothetical protein